MPKLLPCALALAAGLPFAAAPLLDAGERDSATGDASRRQVYATFKDSGGGGVIEFSIDRRSGRLLDERVLARDRVFSRPHKVRVSDDGRYLLATSQHAALKNLLLADLESGATSFLSVDRAPDDLAPWRDRFVVGAEEQMCYVIDASAGKVAHRWFGKHQLNPDGRRIEYVATTPDGTAWTSWQKDAGRISVSGSGSGRKFGSRVVTIDAATGKTIADLPMPRAMPELHLASRRERGPNPEIIIPSTRTNTLLLSMDLYGGVALADLDAARTGEWRNLTYHSVAPDGSWGDAFPDRAVLVESGGKDFVLIANAGTVGGVSWIDLAERRVVQRLDAPAGIGAPVVLEGGRLLAAPVSGKAKWRSFGELRESREPLPELAVFEVSGPASSPRLSLRQVPLPAPAQSIAAVDPTGKDLAFLVSKEELLVVRARSGEIVDRRPNSRKIERIAAR